MMSYDMVMQILTYFNPDPVQITILVSVILLSTLFLFSLISNNNSKLEDVSQGLKREQKNTSSSNLLSIDKGKFNKLEKNILIFIPHFSFIPSLYF